MRLRLALTLALAALALAALARSAPPPRVRSTPAEGRRAAPGGAQATPDAAVPAETGPARVCAARPESGVEAWLAHLERAEATVLPSPLSTDTLGLAVLEDDGTFFYLDKNNNRLLDPVALLRAFYRTHGDDYDFIATYTASGLGVWLGSVGAFASAMLVRNDTQGLGLELFDMGPVLGSPARLQSFLTMNSLDRYPADPDSNIGSDNFSGLDVLAHELGHRWLAYAYVDSVGHPTSALLGRDRSHWNFFMDTDSSLMEGCDWARPASDSFLSDGVTNGFSVLDQYLMGLRPRGDVDSFFVVNAPTAFDPPGVYVPWSNPTLGVGCRGRATFWDPADIEAVNGPRLPDWAAAPHVFRIAFVLVTPRGSGPAPADLAKLALFRARFAPYFAEAVQGHGAMDPALLSQAGHVVITHAPLKDTEDPAAARPLGARVGIAQGGIRLAVDPASVKAYWRPAGAGEFAPVTLAPAGADSFAGTLPALPAGGTAEYYLHASSDSAGIDAFDPPGGPAAPHAYSAGPDLTPPVVVHVPVRRQGVDRLPQKLLARVTDNLGVDSVWVEYAVGGGPAGTLACSRAGRDSFAASLGAGLPAGSLVAYRFVARDRSLAHHLAYSRAGFDTLGVEQDWTLDFENGSEGLTHGAGWYSYRDAWHLVQEASSPAGGTAWKCGDAAPLAYPPHLDSDLYTPSISGITAGTTLRFDHRYDLEEANFIYAFDGARLEISVNGGAWQVLTPAGGYDHLFYFNSNPFQRDTPCWSAGSGGWRSESVDLSPYAPGPVRVRFRMLADNFLGLDGWLVDRVRVTWTGGTLDVPVAGGTVHLGPAWPNPARTALNLAVSLPRAAEAEWSLYDVAGRRVAVLWRGRLAPGGGQLRAALPRLGAGLYFARLALDGLSASTERIAVIR